MGQINSVNNIPYQHAELIMTTNIFIFVLLLHISNASKASKAGETHNNLTNFFELAKTFASNYEAEKPNNITFVQLARIFEDSCKEPGGLLLSKLRICIPVEHKWLIQYPPTMKLSDIFRECWSCNTPTNMTVKISNVQVIEIDVHTLTISMYLLMTWEDQRPVLMTWTALETIYLGIDDEKEIWFPQIKIRSLYL